MREKTEKTTVVKDHKNIDQLLIYANYVLKMFEAIFTYNEPPKILTHKESVSMMIYDMALLYFRYDSDGSVICVVSVYDECPVLLMAELMSCLKDIFYQNVHINEDTYIQDPAGKDLIWGRDNIDDHNEKVWGRKIQHSIWFDDSMAGHS